MKSEKKETSSKTPKEKLIEEAIKRGGITENRKALEDLQEFVSSKLKNIDFYKIRESAWKS